MTRSLDGIYAQGGQSCGNMSDDSGACSASEPHIHCVRKYKYRSNINISTKTILTFRDILVPATGTYFPGVPVSATLVLVRRSDCLAELTRCWLPVVGCQEQYGGFRVRPAANCKALAGFKAVRGSHLGQLIEPPQTADAAVSCCGPVVAVCPHTKLNLT